MNLVDVLALLIVGMGILFGYRSGLIIQAAALGGFLLGVGLIVLLAPQATEYVADMDPFMRIVVVLGAVGGIILVAQAVGSGLGAAIKRRIGRGFLGSIDQGLGAGFGLVRGVFIVWLMGGMLGLVGSSALAAEARQSVVLRTLETRLPSPIVLASELGRLFQEAGLPDVLVGAPPPIDVPDDAPDAAQAEALTATARASTVRVEATACGQFYSGTGWAITPDHFVTNAHVVAGSDRVWISFDGSLDRYAATVVDFDPELDAALLYASGVDAAPLRLATSLPDRGDDAAALGFTGGGRQRLIPGVISRTLSALGRDIYGRAVSAREIIEMRLDVSPGDSGGPVLVAPGVVGGVTFSESQADPMIGYALSPTAVAASVGDSLASTGAVETGPCITLR